MVGVQGAELQKATLPYSYEVDKDACIAYVRSWGPLDIEEVLQAPGVLAEHSDYSTDFGVVVDLRDIHYQPRAKDVVDIARNLISLRQNFDWRVAIVMPQKLALAAELSAAIAQAGGFPLQVFTDLDEAFRWVRPSAS